MTANEIALIITSSTALATVITQVVTSQISAKSAERIKRVEMQTPQAFDALNEFITAYSNLLTFQDARAYIPDGYNSDDDSSYKLFVIACHKLIPFIPSRSLQQKLCDFMEQILKAGKRTSHETDLQFDELTILLGSALIHSRKHRLKRKPNSQKLQR